MSFLMTHIVAQEYELKGLPLNIIVKNKFDEKASTAYLVLTNEVIIDTLQVYVKIKGKQYIYVRDSLNYEIGKLRNRWSQKTYLQLPENGVIMKKTGLWIYCKDGIIVRKNYRLNIDGPKTYRASTSANDTVK